MSIQAEKGISPSYIACYLGHWGIKAVLGKEILITHDKKKIIDDFHT